jgi:methionine-S-sulfoxide reductase
VKHFIIALISFFTTGATMHPAGSQQNDVAYLAGGCFWGMQELLRQLPGVITTEVGYTGGSEAKPAVYAQVKTGTTGHAESVRVVFDPKKTSYEKILHYFFRIHDPTTVNRQGNDVGSQYRSAIFVTNDAQRASATRVIAEITAAKKWPKPIVTQILPAGPWHSAEKEHQDYLQKHPEGYTCHWERP